MNRSFVRLAVVTVLLAPLAGFGWGFDGHRRLAANIHAPFPSDSCLREWISAQQSSSFQARATEPDRWRDSDPDEGPRHYLNIDWAEPVWSYPREWTAVQTRFGNFAIKNGQVPWRVAELYAQLVGNFQAQSSAGAATTVAHLSHYVTDAFSILHATKNANPFYGPDDSVGLHARWESDMFDSRARIDGITSKMTAYFGTLGRASPTDNIFDIVITGNQLVPELIDADVATQGDVAALYAATAELTAKRWGDSLTLLASMIGSAWVDAGSPLLDGMSAGCSKSVAQGDIVLKGHPFPSPPPDASGPDGNGPASPSTPAEPPSSPRTPSPSSGSSTERQEAPSSPSGCATTPGMLVGTVFLVAWRLGRSRRRA